MEMFLDKMIVKESALRGGRPIIAGTGTTVRTIAELYKLGLAAEDIAGELPLGLAQIYAALAYYHLNGCFQACHGTLHLPAADCAAQHQPVDLAADAGAQRYLHRGLSRRAPNPDGLERYPPAPLFSSPRMRQVDIARSECRTHHHPNDFFVIRLGRASFACNDPTGQNDDPVGGCEDVGQVVRDQNDRDALRF